jgi:hypothetical protein
MAVEAVSLAKAGIKVLASPMEAPTRASPYSGALRAGLVKTTKKIWQRSHNPIITKIFGQKPELFGTISPF